MGCTLCGMTTTQLESCAILAELEQIRDSCLFAEHEFDESIANASAQSRASIQNLLHYLAFRTHDLRALQPKLASMGLSSLGRAESGILAGLEAVIALLESLGKCMPPATLESSDFEAGPAKLGENAEHLLGPAPKGRVVRIMVTLPTEAAHSHDFVMNLIAAGTDVVRINCAHDSEQEWLAMIENVRNVNRELGRSCKVLMDLAGPKLRTGAIRHGYRVVRWRVMKDVGGSVIRPTRVALVAKQMPEPLPADAILPVQHALIRAAEPGDLLRLKDSQGRQRQLTIIDKHGDFCIATCSKGAYLLNGTALSLVRAGKVIAEGTVHDLPFVEEPLHLKAKDLLVLTKAPQTQAGLSSQKSNGSAMRKTPHISCTLTEVFSSAKARQPIFFDDGKIEGVIREVHPDHMLVEIVHTGLGGAKLGSAKGINLPETDLSIPAITEKDRHDLDFVAQHADLVGLSFVRSAQDVLELQEELTKRQSNRLGIILKIESRQAFDHLPLIMMAALRHHPVGIMVARGDLAIEVGFDRLAEVQEEILWLSEAAHLPVIWATQVLETLAKTGMPSRAEVTDAAMSVRAECVMLNKGDYITEAVRFLDNILHRMQDHQSKKRSMLRRLAVADFARA
jgi:pyruvate kinase